MDNQHITKSKIITVIRWGLFIPILIIQAGAFLEAEYITWFTGMFLGLFLTVHQDKVTKTIQIPYAVIFTLFVIIFLTGSYVDLKN